MMMISYVRLNTCECERF